MEGGKFCDEALQFTRVAREDVLAKIRAANALNLREVRAVVLESTGDISVLHGAAVDEQLLKGVRRVSSTHAPSCAEPGLRNQSRPPPQ